MKRWLIQHIKQCDLFRFFKTFFITLFALSVFYQGYNIYRIGKVESKISYIYRDLFSTSRRFASFYNNSDQIFLNSGLHQRNGVDIVVNKPGYIRILSVGINKLRSELENIAPGSVWTIAVLENPAVYSHFYPLRPFYQEKLSSFDDNAVMSRIVEEEDIKDTYESFYGCNIKLTEPYHEEGSNQLIRTLYFPIYNNKKLDALLAVDLNASLTSNIVNEYNKEHYTVITEGKSPNIFQTKINLPCAVNGPIVLGVNFIDIVKWMLIPSFILSAILYLYGAQKNNERRFLQRDKMTGFYRRDYYESKLRKMTRFSLLLIDIDNFKRINDTYGHKKGDDVIHQITQRIGRCIRAGDMAIRWGGEEFVCCFENMDALALLDKAELLRKVVEESPIAGLTVTVSIGGVHDTNTTFSSAYKRADAALYESKHNGRNRVTIV